MSKECDNCDKKLVEDKLEEYPKIFFSYKTFYFCSEQCKEEYVN